jgi:acyl-CoA thioester hydrolase
LFTHEATLDVRFYELDPYNHVNHAVYFSYFETGRIEALESVGMGLHALEDMGFRIVVTNIEADFVRSVEPGSPVVVTTQVEDVKRVSQVWNQTMTQAGEVVARARVRAAMTDTAGRPIRIPGFFRSALSGDGRRTDD